MGEHQAPRFQWLGAGAPGPTLTAVTDPGLEPVHDALTPVHQWKWVLGDDGEPQPEPDVIRWATWFEANDEARQLHLTEMDNGAIRVSTVFLAIGFAERPGEMPPLFETKVFDDKHRHPIDMLTFCAPTRAEANECHDAAVLIVVALLKKAAGSVTGHGGIATTEDQPGGP